MKEAALSLGSNLGNRVENLSSAIRALNLLCGTSVISVSHNYETEPFGVEGQPMYLNCCAKIMTELSPVALLGACLGIEAAMGRYRVVPQAARPIDIDVLMFEGVRVQTEELTLPHPRMMERAFVLVPLQDIYPEMVAMGMSFEKALEHVDPSGVILYCNTTRLPESDCNP